MLLPYRGEPHPMLIWDPFLCLLLGAFVAGLDAGLVYNSFPKMADRWCVCGISVVEHLAWPERGGMDG